VLSQVLLSFSGLGVGPGTCGPDHHFATILRLARVTNSTRHSFREEVINQPHAKYQHGYAVVRIEMSVSVSNPEDSLVVVKVFSSKTSAEVETICLNKVNAQKRCKYVVLVTNLIPDK
jgi:hypothetical protein